MRNFILLVSMLIVSILPAYSQKTEEKTVTQQDLQDLNKGLYILKSFNVGYEGVRGNPFLYDDWSVGIIVMINGDSIKEQKLKLDIYQDQLIVQDKRSGQPMTTANKLIRGFVITDSLGIDHNFLNTLPDEEDSESKRTGYFEVLYEGNNKLLAKHRKKFQEADYEGAYNAGRKYDQFLEESGKYYLLKSDKTVFELKRSKKGLLKSLGDDGSIEKIIKEHKFDIKREKDLIDLIAVIDKKL